MSIANATGLIETVFQNTLVFDVTWVISIVLTFFTLLIITREAGKWKTLAFPVMLGWHICGVTPSYVIYLMLGIVFVIDALSLQAVGELLQIASTKATSVGKSIYESTESFKIKKAQKDLDRDWERATRSQRRGSMKKYLRKQERDAKDRAIWSKIVKDADMPTGIEDQSNRLRDSTEREKMKIQVQDMKQGFTIVPKRVKDFVKGNVPKPVGVESKFKNSRLAMRKAFQEYMKAGLTKDEAFKAVGRRFKK